MHSSRMRTVRSSGRLSRGVYVPGGCLLWGVSAPGRVSAARGVCSWGDVCSVGVSALGGGIPACIKADTPIPLCGQTDACKNITFATSLRTVNIFQSIVPNSNSGLIENTVNSKQNAVE